MQKRKDPHGRCPANTSVAYPYQRTPRPQNDAGQQKGMSPADFGQQNPGNGSEKNSRKREALKEG